MASQDESNSFEAIIHADRARKKNEDLANQIFGRSKSSQNAKKNQKETRSPSLASRMGVQKRTSSTSTPPQKNPFNPPSRPSSTTPSHSFRNSRERDHQSSARASRIANEIESGNANITTSREGSFTTLSKTAPRNGTQGPGLTIKGSAGPFTVHLSNFAPGTTEADIEAALHTDLLDDKGCNCLETCRLISSRPSVVAEMVFSERSVADNIVSKFNNLKADGRILKVAIVKTGPNRERERDSKSVGNGIAQSIEPNVSPQDAPTSVAEGDMEMDDVDTPADHPAASSYDHEREAADRDRRDRDRDRDRDGYAAGRRDNRERGHDRREDRDRDRDRRRDERERDRDDDRDRDREREGDRDRDRDRDFDRRDTQPQAANYNNRPAGPPPQAPYGNGFNRPPPGVGYGYGGPRGYGYHRGGYGARGGGYRGYGR